MINRKFEKFIKEDRQTIKDEHARMGMCPKCKSKNVEFVMQSLSQDFTDTLIYKCRNCSLIYDEEFELPAFKMGVIK